MSVVSLLGVKVLNNPAPFDAKYQFEITFECLEPLQKGSFSIPPSHMISGNDFCSQTLNGSLHTWDLLRRK